MQAQIHFSRMHHGALPGRGQELRLWPSAGDEFSIFVLDTKMDLGKAGLSTHAGHELLHNFARFRRLRRFRMPATTIFQLKIGVDNWYRSALSLRSNPWLCRSKLSNDPSLTPRMVSYYFDKEWKRAIAKCSAL